MTRPDIVFIAYRYKAGTAYSILPEDGSADIAFARASSATRVNSSGLIESVATDVPRIDYTGGGCPALLLEVSRTNIGIHSKDFANAAWTKSGNITVTSDATSSPISGVLADSIVTTAGNIGDNALYQARSITIGDVKVASAYLKPIGAATWVICQLINGTFNGLVYIDLVTGQIGSTVGDAFAKVTAEIGQTNGFTRVGFAFTAELTGNCEIAFYAATGNNSINTGITPGAGHYITGFQFEDGLFPTSYIPTVASATTRAVDTPDPIAITPTPTGTLLIDLTTCLSDAVGDVGVALKDSSANQIEVLFNGADNENLVSSDGDDEATYKAAGTVVISFDGTDTRVYRAGALVETLDPITDDIESINFVQVGQTRAPKFAFWYTKLSDTECIQRSLI